MLLGPLGNSWRHPHRRGRGLDSELTRGDGPAESESVADGHGKSEKVVEPVSNDVLDHCQVDIVVAVNEHVGETGHARQLAGHVAVEPSGAGKKVEQLRFVCGSPSDSSDTICDATSRAA